MGMVAVELGSLVVAKYKKYRSIFVMNRNSMKHIDYVQKEISSNSIHNSNLKVTQIQHGIPSFINTSS